MSMTPEDFYKASGLVANPFRTNPIYAADPRSEIWVGYEKERERFLKFLTRARADQVGNANFIMVYGPYGTGKSHALLWGQNRILHTNKGEFDSVCYFVPTLKKDKGKLTFAGAFLDDLVLKSTLVSDLIEYKHFLESSVVRYRDEQNEPHTTKTEEIITKLIPAVEMNSLAIEIQGCDNEDQLRSLLSPKGLTDYQAMVIFTRLSNLFVHEMSVLSAHRRFKKGVYLFIDELDDLLRAPVKEVRETNDILRHIYDSCPNSFGLVIALSATNAELPAIFEDYILSRIQRQIVLDLLDKDDAVHFVGEVLNRSRVNTKGKFDPFFPFDEDAIDAIISQLVEITPRKVVNTMQQILEELRLAGYNPSDGLVTIQTLDDTEVLEEVFGEGGLG